MRLSELQVEELISRVHRLEMLLVQAKLCRSYFFEDPNRAYEILADALREIEG